MRKGAGRLRVTAQLIDAADGAHVWAERRDRPLDDIFAVRDELTPAVANEMQVRLTEGEQARLRYTATSSFEAWTAWVQGLWHYRRRVAKESMGPARQHWERALALDPGSAAIHAMLGFLHRIDARFGWRDNRGTAPGRAGGHVDRALEVDPGDAGAHTSFSLVRHFEERFEEAVATARRGVQLAPGSANTAELASFVIALAGFPEEAIGLSKRAITLSPSHPPVYLGQPRAVYRLAGRIEEATVTFRDFDAFSPGFGLVDLAIIYQDQGRETEARETVRALPEAGPGFTIAAHRHTQFRSDKARLAEDLAALAPAGLPPGDRSA